MRYNSHTMNTLILFATNSGATDIVSQLIADTLTQNGQTVTRKMVHETSPDDLGNFDAIVLGSPSWDFDGKEGQPHEDYFPFMEKLADKTFENKPFAVFGLGDSSYTHFCGAVEHLEALVAKLKGKKIIDSLKIDGFYYKQDIHTQSTKTWAENLAKALTG